MMISGTGSHSRDLELVELLDDIVDGTVVLPNFQRDFDWNEPDVVSLLATVLCGWPAGSLLMMDGAPTFFDVREFDDAPPRAGTIKRVVLDGQQRLTSLFHAFRGAGPKVYTLNVDRILTEQPSAEDLEDALVVMSRREFDSERQKRVMRDGRSVPLHVASTAPEFYEWRDDIVSSAPHENRDEISKRLTQAYKFVLSNANRYKFPTILLDPKMEPAAIARIFERINRTGMRLSTSDLLVARSYTTDWNLREQWQEARQELPYLDEFLGEDGLMAAQALALRAGGDVRQPAVLDLSRDLIQREWRRGVEACSAAGKFLVEAGVLNASWMPFKSQFLPLAALALDHDLATARKTLLNWFWGSSFSAAYEVASSTVANDDYRRLKRMLESDIDARKYVVSRSRLRVATRRQDGAIWRSTRALLLHHGARDPLRGHLLAEESEDSLTTISMFPRSEVNPSLHQLALSQVLVLKDSVRALRNKPISVRSATELDEQFPKTQFVNASDHIHLDAASALDVRLSGIENFLVDRYGDMMQFAD